MALRVWTDVEQQFVAHDGSNVSVVNDYFKLITGLSDPFFIRDMKLLLARISTGLSCKSDCVYTPNGVFNPEQHIGESKSVHRLTQRLFALTIFSFRITVRLFL